MNESLLSNLLNVRILLYFPTRYPLRVGSTECLHRTCLKPPRKHPEQFAVSGHRGSSGRPGTLSVTAALSVPFSFPTTWMHSAKSQHVSIPCSGTEMHLRTLVTCWPPAAHEAWDTAHQPQPQHAHLGSTLLGAVLSDFWSWSTRHTSVTHASLKYLC